MMINQENSHPSPLVRPRQDLSVLGLTKRSGDWMLPVWHEFEKP